LGRDGLSVALVALQGYVHGDESKAQNGSIAPKRETWLECPPRDVESRRHFLGKQRPDRATVTRHVGPFNIVDRARLLIKSPFPDRVLECALSVLKLTVTTRSNGHEMRGAHAQRVTARVVQVLAAVQAPMLLHVSPAVRENVTATHLEQTVVVTVPAANSGVTAVARHRDVALEALTVGATL
jgi:hypothetical protein